MSVTIEAFAVLLLVTAPEDPVPIEDVLRLEPGASCLEHARLARRIATWLGRDTVERRLDVLVTGHPSDPRKLEFRLREDDVVIAERPFAFTVPKACDDLHAVVGLSIALAIDATVLDDVAPRTGRERIELPPPPRLPARNPELGPLPEARAVPAPSRPRTSVWLTADGGVTIGVPPPAAGIGAVALEILRWERLGVGLGGLGGGTPRQAAGPGRAAFALVAARLFGCGGERWQRWRVQGCVGVLAGAALASGTAFDENRTASVPWMAVELRTVVRVRLSDRIDFATSGGAWLHAIRPAFDFLDANGIRRATHEFGLASGQVSVGLAVRLRP